MTSATLTIIRGVPGSGKTTEAKRLISAGEADDFVEADMYFDRLHGGKFRPNLVGHAHEWCQEQVRRKLTAGKRVVVSNTFTQEWEIAPYLSMARWMHVPVKVIKMTGEFENVHGVPGWKVANMRRRWEDVPGEESRAPAQEVNA